MTTRHSPIRHVVHKHSRLGKPVRRYTRGEGEREKVKTTHHIHRPFTNDNKERYAVSIKYEEGRPFNIVLHSANLESALHRGIEISPDRIPSVIVLKEVS